MRVRSFVPLLAVLAAAVTARADRLDVAVPLGGTVTADVVAPGDVATIGFLVTEGPGRKLSFQIKRGKGSKLEPDVAVIAPDGTPFDLTAHGGKVVATPKSWKAKLPEIPAGQSGLWRVAVKGANGSSGAFALVVKGKDTTVVSGTATIPAKNVLDVAFTAGSDVMVDVTAKRSGATSVVPQLLILDPNGQALESGQPFIGDEKKGTLRLKSYRLPLFGRYLMRFTGLNGLGGSISYVISTKPAKIKGKIPTSRAGDAFEVEPSTAGTLDGSGSTPVGSTPLTYRWTQVTNDTGPVVQLSNVSSPAPTFTATSATGTLAFQLSVAENGVLSRTSVVAVEVAKRPVADAGRSLAVDSNAAVALDGSASLARRAASLQFAWRQIPGDDATVTLTGADTAKPTFTAPSGTHVLHFGLVVDDGAARSFEDVVVVSVGDATLPVADAGREQYVSRMATVHLGGLASTTPTGVLDVPILWTQVSGPPVVLAGADTPWPSFTAMRGTGDVVFELRVGGAAATADRTAVHVRNVPIAEIDVAPAAQASNPLTIGSGSLTLRAADTVDLEGDPLTFRWAQIAGAPAALSDSASATPNVDVPAGNAMYLYAVMPNDGLQNGAPDWVAVRNAGYDLLPIAIGTASVTTAGKKTVHLDGSGSVRTDGGQGPLTYRWTQISGVDWFDVASNVPGFDGTSATPSFVIPDDLSSLTPIRVLLFSLVVDDGVEESPADLVAVTLTGLPRNGKPAVTASVSDMNPVVGQVVTLLGTAFDRDGDPMTFAWTQKSGPFVQVLPNTATLQPTFVAPASGTLAFQLKVNDGIEDGDPVQTPNIVVDRKPTVVVSVSPLAGTPGTFVTMDATQSVDPEGNLVTYQWTQTGGTPVSINPTGSTITFTAPAGAVTFRLLVNDGRQNSDPRNVAFSGNPPPTVAPTASRVDSTYGAAYGSQVTLSPNPGSGGPFTYTWRQINPQGVDPTVTLSGTTEASPTFNVPLPTSAPFGQTPQATFGVVASDGVQSSTEGTVTVRFFATYRNNNNGGSTGNNIRAMIDSYCIRCHSGTGNNTSPCNVGSGSTATGYGMARVTSSTGTVDGFLANSLGVAACSTTSKTRLPATGVNGAATSNSYLFDRVTGAATPRMPSSGSSPSTTEVNILQDWIDQGVHDN